MGGYMKILTGETINTGIAIGKIKIMGNLHPREEYAPDDRMTDDPVSEIERFRNARIRVLSEIHELFETMMSEFGLHDAQIFEMHEMLLNDGGLIASCESMILEEGHLAEYAVVHGFNDKADFLAAIPDPLISSRSADILELRDEVLRELLAEERGYSGRKTADGQIAAGAGTEDIRKGSDPAEVNSTDILSNDGLTEPGRTEDKPGDESLTDSGNSEDITDGNSSTGYDTDRIIVAADDLTTVEAARLDRSRTAGVVLRQGSPNSHASILIRGMGIPVIIRCADITTSADGQLAVIDGDSGWVYINPNENTLEKYTARIKETGSALNSVKGESAVTRRGKRVILYANINDPSETTSAIDNDAEGIGLYRSEFLILKKCDAVSDCNEAEKDPALINTPCEKDDIIGNNSFPSEHEQYEAYKQILETMSPRPVIIRAFDIGADKMPDTDIRETDTNGFKAEQRAADGVISDTNQGTTNGITTDKAQEAAGGSGDQMYRESNPALGVRGVRFLLEHEDIFRSQLRALLRASVYGELSIMIPMISRLEELTECRRILEECKQELIETDGVSAGAVGLGIMIETPSAALMAEELAKEADFFSIGTNDLIQYTYAADRLNSSAQKAVDPDLCAVIRLMETAVRAAHKNHIPVGICGELASNTAFTARFLEIGVDELSVNPSKILEMKKHIRGLDI